MVDRTQPAVVLPPRLATRRLVLRIWHHDEAALLGATITANLEHLRPWMPWAKFEPLTLAERVALIEGWTRSWEEGGDAVYGVFADGEVVGGCGLHRRSTPDTVDIGYWIAATHLRRGFATELTSGLTSAALALDGVANVRLLIDEANVASAGVPARLGFAARETIVRPPDAPGETGRLQSWTMTLTDWTERLQRP